MTGLRATLKGDEALNRAIAKLQAPDSDAFFRRALVRTGALIKAEIRADVSGRVINVVTGRYLESFDTDLNMVQKSIAVGTPEVRARPFEFGWPAKNMRRRQHIEPSLDRALARIPDIFVEEMERQVQ